MRDFLLGFGFCWLMWLSVAGEVFALSVCVDKITANVWAGTLAAMCSLLIVLLILVVWLNGRGDLA